MIHHVPENTYVEVVHDVCEYHKTHRNPNYAGCMCSSKYTLKVRRPWRPLPDVGDRIEHVQDVQGT